MGGHGGLNILPQVRRRAVRLERVCSACSLHSALKFAPLALTARPRCATAAPQKRWNVYGREQRLKVARDEAKYEEEQAAIREKAEAADRERRRQLLLQRARQRYGVRRLGCLLLAGDSAQHALLVAWLEWSAVALRSLQLCTFRCSAVAVAAAQPCLPQAGLAPNACHVRRIPSPRQDQQALGQPDGAAPPLLDHPSAAAAAAAVAEAEQAWQQPPAAASWEPDAEAMRGLAAGQADHMAALEQQAQQAQRQHGHRGPAPPLREQRQRKRGRWEAPAAAAGPPPSLAELAAQLDAPNPLQQEILVAGSGRGGGQQAFSDQQQRQEQQQAGGRLERFNLFAAEEALAAKRKNPEVEVGAGGAEAALPSCAVHSWRLLGLQWVSTWQSGRPAVVQHCLEASHTPAPVLCLLCAAMPLGCLPDCMPPIRSTLLLIPALPAGREA